MVKDYESHKEQNYMWIVFLLLNFFQKYLIVSQMTMAKQLISGQSKLTFFSKLSKSLLTITPVIRLKICF